MKMKRTLFVLATLLGLGNVSGTAAQEATDATITPGLSVDRFSMERIGKYLSVELDMDLTALDVEANRAVLLTPRLVGKSDSLDLPSVGIYGRTRYYYYQRNGMGSISGAGEQVCRASEKPDGMEYRNTIVFEEWMDGATLKIRRSDWGCCRAMLAQYEGRLGRYDEAFFPELVFVQPEAETMKSRSLSGSAFIDFPVNKTVIYPDYRRNAAELGKIGGTIDSVRNDRDVSIVSVYLKGYASPESPYEHNRELAIGRTGSLKEHIGRLYRFADGVIVTEFEPEDWEGLRRFVEHSNLDHRTELLELIDSDLEPDAKEARIKRTYPEDYRFLLQHCYPSLRRTDYRIDYVIRSYSDAEEIKRILAERPQNLSLNEFYLVAATYEPGTAEFTDVFETAVRMFPNDEAANLNAANAAMRHGDHAAAHRYLDKAGDSAEAVYARGALAIREKEYAKAAACLEQARRMGLGQAETTLKELTERGYTE